MKMTITVYLVFVQLWTWSSNKGANIEVQMEPTQFFRLQKNDMVKLKAEIENEIKNQIRQLDRQYSMYKQLRDSQYGQAPSLNPVQYGQGPPSPFPFYMLMQSQRLLGQPHTKSNQENSEHIVQLNKQLGKLNDQIVELKNQIKKTKSIKNKVQSKITTIVHTSNSKVDKVKQNEQQQPGFKETDQPDDNGSNNGEVISNNGEVISNNSSVIISQGYQNVSQIQQKVGDSQDWKNQSDILDLEQQYKETNRVPENGPISDPGIFEVDDKQYQSQSVNTDHNQQPQQKDNNQQQQHTNQTQQQQQQQQQDNDDVNRLENRMYDEMNDNSINDNNVINQKMAEIKDLRNGPL